MSQPYVLLQNIQPFYFSQNIPDIYVTSIDPIEVSVQILSPLLNTEFTEYHEPDAENYVKLMLADVITRFLELSGNISESFEISRAFYQSKASALITINADGHAEKTFIALKGTVDAPYNYDFLQYAKDNMLNLCPQVRYVYLNQPNALNYFCYDDSSFYRVRLTATFITGYSAGLPVYDTDEATYVEFDTFIDYNNLVATFDAKFARLLSYFSLPAESEIVHIDVVIQDDALANVTPPMRLILETAENADADFFAFENSMGGIDVIRFTGVLSEIIDHEYLSLINRKHRLEHNAILLTAYKKNTGYFESQEEADFAADFFASSQRYHYSNNQFKRIFITEKDAAREHGEISSYTFNFAYAHQHAGKLLSRQSEL